MYKIMVFDVTPLLSFNDVLNVEISHDFITDLSAAVDFSVSSTNDSKQEY